MNMAKMLLVGALVAGLVTSASALTVSDIGTVSFTSDLNPNDDIVLDSFDTSLGILTGVTVNMWHTGSVATRGDNDDPFNTADVQARMIRTWSATGPGVFGVGTHTVNSATQTLGLDDGDGSVFDSAAPDGYDFGTLSYSNLSAGSFVPGSTAAYQTAGPGSVTFTVDPLNMVNDLNFVNAPPDVWQLEVQDPILDVTVQVVYDYVIPEPATLSLLALGAFALVRRRR